MTDFDPDRRTVLMAGGAALTAGLAGCLGGGGDDNGGDNGGDNGDDNGGEMSPEDEVDSYLNDNDANNYDGSVVDETGASELTIEVGPDGNFQFNPAAVRIDSGTAITWEWLSDGHSVEQTDSDLEFEDSEIQNEGATHEHTFDSAGVFLYQCGPHSAQGHHGGIIIE